MCVCIYLLSCQNYNFLHWSIIFFLIHSNHQVPGIWQAFTETIWTHLKLSPFFNIHIWLVKNVWSLLLLQSCKTVSSSLLPLSLCYIFMSSFLTMAVSNWTLYFFQSVIQSTVRDSILNCKSPMHPFLD